MKVLILDGSELSKESNIKILIITPAYYPSSFGGIKSHVINLSTKLVKKGHEVTVCTPNAYNFSKNMDIEGEKLYEGVKVVYFNNCFPKRYWFIPGIVSYLNKNIALYDVVHMHNNYSFSNTAAYYFLNKYKLPYLFTPHGSLQVSMQNIFFKNLYNKTITKRMIHNSYKSIALNEMEYHQFIDFGISPQKIEIIPNGINLDEFKLLPDKYVFRKKYSIPNDELILMFLGRIHKIKGIDLLLKSFARILTTFNKIRLVIVGPNFGYLDKCHELGKKLKIQNRVLYTGPLFGVQKIEALVSCDIFVLPSIYDTFPAAVLEACACGKPIIISNKVGIANFIERKAGIVINHDEKELTEELKMMLKNSAKRKKFGAGSLDLVKNHFDFEKITDKYIKIYHSAISNMNLKK